MSISSYSDSISSFRKPLGHLIPKFSVRNCVTAKEDSSVSTRVTLLKPTNLSSQIHWSDSDIPTTEQTHKAKRKYYRHKSSKNSKKLGDRASVPEDAFRLPKISQRKQKSKGTKSVTFAKPVSVHGMPKPKTAVTPTLTSTFENSRAYSFYVENEYTRFTLDIPEPPLSASASPRRATKKQGVSAILSQRLFHLTKQLRKCHVEYNNFLELDERDTFLTNEILQRYVMALDLALTEAYFGIALEIVSKMYDSTKHMIPLYANIFYGVDGTHAPLPIMVTGTNDFLKSLTPLIYALNRIPFSSTSPDKNGHLRLETHLMKLQLEVLVLVTAPVHSAVFRATLEVVPNTAFTAYQRLVTMNLGLLKSSFRWDNDSVMKKEYSDILEKFGLADQLGCKGSLATINQNNQSKSSRRVNCDSELEMSDGESIDFH